MQSILLHICELIYIFAPMLAKTTVKSMAKQMPSRLETFAKIVFSMQFTKFYRKNIAKLTKVIADESRKSNN